MRSSALLLVAACGGATHSQAVAPTPSPTTAPSARVDPAPARAIMPPAATATRVRDLAGITEYRLSNGLQILLFPDPSQPNVTVNVTYLVGSRVEGYGETGMAHLLEHMTFKGTPRHRNIMKLVDDRGGTLNGSTWTDRTNYFETLPATADNLDWMLDLEADRMVNCPIAADDLATEFSVVRNELEQDENDVARQLEARMTSTAYLWHNYGKDTIGSRSDIERVPADRLRAFYQRWYQPDDAVLVVAGAFDSEQALATIIRTFGAIPRPTRTLDATYTVEPVQDGEREVTLRRAGKNYLVGVVYHVTAGSTPDFTAATAALDVLTREPSGALYKKLVATHLASSVGGVAYSFKEPSIAMVMAQVPDGKNVEQVKKILTETIEGLGDAAIADAAVERWRAGWIKAFDLRQADVESSALVLSEYAALGDWRTMFSQRDQVARVGAADVRRVAHAYFKPSNRTLGVFVPTAALDRAPLAETPDVHAIAEQAPAPASIAGEPFDATIDSIEAHVVRKDLKGGLRAAFLPKKTRAGRVTFDLRLDYGDATSLAGKSVAAMLAAAMLERGTKQHDLQALRDLADKLEADIQISGTATALHVHVSTFRDRLPGAIDLIAEELTQPSFPAAELEVVRAQYVAYEAESSTEPSWRARNEVRRRLEPWPKTDPRYTMTFDEQVAGLRAATIGDVRGFWRDVMGADHGQVAVVGDFDADAVAAQLEAKLGGWHAKKPYTRLADKRFDVPGGAVTIDTPDKEKAEIEVEAQVGLGQDDPDYPAWLMLGYVFGGGGGSRAWMRLREHEGLSYGVWGWTTAGDLDPVGSIGCAAIVAPQNLAKARASLLDELGALLGRPVTADELERARTGWLEELTRGLAGDDFIASELADQLFLGHTFAWRKALEAKVKALTPADLTAVAAKYIHPDALIVVEAGDQKKANAPTK